MRQMEVDVWITFNALLKKRVNICIDVIFLFLSLPLLAQFLFYW